MQYTFTVTVNPPEDQRPDFGEEDIFQSAAALAAALALNNFAHGLPLVDLVDIGVTIDVEVTE